MLNGSTVLLSNGGTHDLSVWEFEATVTLNTTSANDATVNVPAGAGANIAVASPTTGGGVITVEGPLVNYQRTVSGAPVGSAIAIFPRSSSLIADIDQFTLAAGNTSGSSTLVVNEAIPADTPSTGFVRVARDDGTEDRLAYSSWSGSTFTLAGTLPVTYGAGNGAYVGYLDVLGSVTGTESVSLQFVANRSCVLRVRLGSGASRIINIEQDITLTESDFELQVSPRPDAINTST